MGRRSRPRGVITPRPRREKPRGPGTDRPRGRAHGEEPGVAKLWAKHPVQNCVSGWKSFRHPEIGDFDLHFEVLTPPDESGHRVLFYTADPGTAAVSALDLLARDAESHRSRTAAVR
nr:hypothetical protein [Curtobacterium sp. ISL-83]